jgi:hypothetical protein
MAFISDLFNTVGPIMFLGLIGLYLIIVAIAGQFIPRNIRLKTMKQRKLLGAFGFLLFAPTLLSLYIEFFTKFTPSTFSPNIEEQVIEREQVPGDSLGSLELKMAPQPIHFAGIFSGSLTSNQSKSRSQKPVCQRVEYFGLQEKNIRRLKHSKFGNRVFIYVGDIYYNRPFDIYLAIGKNLTLENLKKELAFYQRFKQTDKGKIIRLRVEKAGDALEFEYAGKTFRLKVVKIYAVFFGKNKLVMEICEQRR